MVASTSLNTIYSISKAYDRKYLVFPPLRVTVLSMTKILESYSPRKAAELSGIGSISMLDYLQRVGVFFPEGRKGKRGRGKQRKYTFRDVLTLKAIRRILDAGASVSAINKALENFQKHTWSADPVTLEDRNGVIRYFIVYGDQILLEKDAQALINLSCAGQLEFSFILDLDKLHGDLCEDLGLARPQRELAF
jgi:DNA-binding transcriptional MerR regulator